MAEGLAWDQWVQRHGAAALLFARQYCRSQAQAEDAVQEGFVRFWRARERARDPVGLLFASVRSAALDLQRSQRRRVLRERKVFQERPLFAAADADAGLRREDLERALGELPEAQRVVVVLKIWAGLTFAQVAEAVGESANTVASRYRYALEKLGEILTPEVRHE